MTATSQIADSERLTANTSQAVDGAQIVGFWMSSAST
jgi:hypothetical protein